MLTHSHVTKVLVEDGRATGVEIDRFSYLVFLILAFNVHPQRFGERLSLKATREVVLSAGSVGTAQILLLSGIGDPDHLKEVGRNQQSAKR